jgi:cell division protein FtsB
MAFVYGFFGFIIGAVIIAILSMKQMDELQAHNTRLRKENNMLRSYINDLEKVNNVK